MFSMPNTLKWPAIFSMPNTLKWPAMFNMTNTLEWPAMFSMPNTLDWPVMFSMTNTLDWPVMFSMPNTLSDLQCLVWPTCWIDQLDFCLSLLQALQAPACHENMVKVGGYILGEFGNLIAGDPRSRWGIVCTERKLWDWSWDYTLILFFSIFRKTVSRQQVDWHRLSLQVSELVSHSDSLTSSGGMSPL